MLNNFWYACEFSHAVTDQPKQIELWNQKIVLYRDATGKVVALKDQCPHRGAALSLGKVHNGCIQCPYHGWQFQTDGTCSKIPSNPPHAQIPKRARTNSYLTQERYGFIWLFWGNLPPEECPPLPTFSNFFESGFQATYCELTLKAHYSRVLENIVDPIHSVFVHGDTFGNGQDPYLWGRSKAVVEDWSARISRVITQPMPKLLQLLLRKKMLESKVDKGFHLPNVSFISIDYQLQIPAYFAFIPVKENITLLKTIQFRNFLTYSWADSWAGGLLRKFVERTFREDLPIVESQPSRSVPNDLTEEINVAGDSMSVAYRKLRKKSMEKYS